MCNQYEVSIEYSPVYELLISFYAYVHQKEINLLQFGYGAEWKRETKQQLPPSFAAELEDHRWEVLHRLVLLVAHSPQKQKESVEQFLMWLGKLPADEIYQYVAPWADNLHLTMEEFRDQTISLLSRWDAHYFSRLPQKTLVRLQEHVRDLRQNLRHMEAPAFVDLATSGVWIEPTGKLKRIILAPQVHCAPATILDFHGEVATAIYPVIDELIIKDVNTRSLLAMTQALGDENRLRILRILAENTTTLHDIQQRIGLAKSTVHHHITVLRRTGLIRAHYRDSSLVHAYSLRQATLEKLPHLLNQFLYSGGE